MLFLDSELVGRRAGRALRAGLLGGRTVRRPRRAQKTQEEQKVEKALEVEAQVRRRRRHGPLNGWGEGQ